MPSPCHCSAIMISTALAARRWRKISTRIMPHCVVQLQCLLLLNIYLVTCRNSPKTYLKRTSSPRKFAPRNPTLHTMEILVWMAVATIIQTKELKAIAGSTHINGQEMFFCPQATPQGQDWRRRENQSRPNANKSLNHKGMQTIKV